MARSISGAARGGRWRWLRRTALSCAATIAAYVALAVHPQPLFAYSTQRGNVVLDARQPLPAEAIPMLDDADAHAI